MIQGFWENLSPKSKRIVAVGLGVVVIISIVSMFSGQETKERKTSREESIRHILTDTNTREVGIDALSADLKLVARENETLKRDLERFKDEVARNTGAAFQNDALSRDVARMQEELKKLKEQNRELSQKIKSGASISSQDGDTSNNGRQGGADSDRVNGVNRVNEADLSYSNPEDLFKNAPVPAVDEEADQDGRTKRGQPSKPKSLVITSYSSSSEESDEDADVVTEQDDIYMPAGSIITGVLITGMDAPTAQGARQDPFPATLRIQKEAILPNRFRADIRECFLIVSGYGDLSSERAYLRGETLSCVKDNGEVIEAPFDSYAVGEDGKAGVRGRLVSKQGQIIAKSLMAGFLSGAAEAFDVDAVPTLNLDNTGQTQFQKTEFSNTLAQGAAAKGASSALDRIAQFYIQMAEGIFPVIEIDAGRQVEIIVTKGSSLRVRGSKAE
ncbi:TraB/VirB10 family protein [Marinobacterium aestuariivivens]|uniref:TraB/VirB10 family protein n=1 Tax=Marinobacterium aestuariivivens TaxID=1698799 RepID=A0ABW2A9F1_9GAMM